MPYPKLDSATEVLLEHEVQRLGRHLHDELKGRSPGIFRPAFWQGLIMQWAMENPALRTDLFRLVDVLPALSSSAEVARHAREYLLVPGRTLPPGMDQALQLTRHRLAGTVSAFVIRRNVQHLAAQLLAGDSARDAAPRLRKLWREGYAFAVDLLGEATLGGAEADAYLRRYTELIDFLPPETARWKSQPLLDVAPRANISIKLSALDPQLDPLDPDAAVARLEARLRPLLRSAKASGAFIHFDMEQWSLHEIYFRLFERVALEPEFAAWPHLGIVVQAYLRRSGEDIDRLVALAKRRNAPLTVRLVRGAYWDYELIQARQLGSAIPVFTEKAEADAQYERLAGWLLDERRWLGAAYGTHNLRSITKVLARAEQLGLPPEAYEFQVLYGMAEPEREALRARGHRVRLYAPLGDLFTGMAYLVRRLLENTANSSFLRQNHHDKIAITDLLAPPAPTASAILPAAFAPRPGEFKNAPLTDFLDPGAREAFVAALAKVQTELPLNAPVIINGETRNKGDCLFHIAPAEKTRIATELVCTTPAEIEEAVRVAREAFPAWRDTPVERRAACLHALGERLSADRAYLAATQVYEQAKPWREADADVAEAIDFCHYYAERALVELKPAPLTSLPGESNCLLYEGRGLTAVIAPWNFPLAILTGMSVGALVSGNAVLLKPAEQASGVAHQFVRHAFAAGIPPGVLALLPGAGEVVGAALARHPEIAQIGFTGSRAVGCAILRQAADLAPGQRLIKRAVIEMGGKNAIIVDDDADLDEAIAGTLRSAFGYAGQKCSAGSRLIVLESIAGPFLQRLADAAASLPAPCAATEPGCLVPPVIDEAAQSRLRHWTAQPPAGAKLIFQGSAPETGWYVPVTIFEVDDARHPLWQDELFGPILTLMRVRDFATALLRANDSAYALTGSLYSRSPLHLEQARAEFRVGNLYLNRGTTGAAVARQPFGGFRLSGNGTKAGGPGYLLNFIEQRVCTENTLRRGFTPETAE